MEKFGNSVRETGVAIKGKVCQFAHVISNEIKAGMADPVAQHPSNVPIIADPEDLPPVPDLPMIRKIILQPMASVATQTDADAEVSTQIDVEVQVSPTRETEPSECAASPTMPAPKQIAQLGCDISHVDRVKLCESAVEHNGLAIQWVPVEILTVKLEQKAVKSNGLSLQFIPEHHRTSTTCHLAVRQNGLSLQFVPNYLKSQQMCKLAVSQNPLALEWCYTN